MSLHMFKLLFIRENFVGLNKFSDPTEISETWNFLENLRKNRTEFFEIKLKSHGKTKTKRLPFVGLKPMPPCCKSNALPQGQVCISILSMVNVVFILFFKEKQ